MAAPSERPLEGRTVVVTRPRAQAASLIEGLRALGAEPLAVPMIEIVDPSDAGAALAAAVERVASYEWVVLTSPNGAERFCAHLGDRPLGTTRLATIGPGTAEVLETHGLRAELLPDTYVAESLLDAFPAPTGGGRVLLARAETARDVLPDGLAALGWSVDVVTAYRTVGVEPDDDVRREVASADIVTFTSSSTVDHWVAAFGTDALPAIVACIGPVTAETARVHGITVDVEAEVHTVDGLLSAIVGHVSTSGRTTE